MALRQEQPIVPSALDQWTAGFHQSLPEAGQRPVSDPLRQPQSSPDIPQVVNDQTRPQTDLVGPEPLLSFRSYALSVCFRFCRPLFLFPDAGGFTIGDPCPPTPTLTASARIWIACQPSFECCVCATPPFASQPYAVPLATPNGPWRTTTLLPSDGLHYAVSGDLFRHWLCRNAQRR